MAFALATVLTCGSAFAQSDNATPADYVQAVNVMRSTCVATFPRFDGITAKLSAQGFSQTKHGNWTSDLVFVGLQGVSNPVGRRTCMVTLRNLSKTAQMSDAIQQNISKFKLQKLSQTRKGVRYTASFQYKGSAGTMRTEPLGGRTSSLILRVSDQ